MTRSMFRALNELLSTIVVADNFLATNTSTWHSLMDRQFLRKEVMAHFCVGKGTKKLHVTVKDLKWWIENLAEMVLCAC